MNPPPSFDEGNLSAGALRVQAGIGTNLWGTTVTGSFLYQNVTTWNYSTTLKVYANPSVPGQRAGLLCYNNNSAWTALLYGNDSTGMKLTRISTWAGSSVQTNISLEAAPLYLRLDRGYSGGTTLRYFYSNASSDWTPVYSMNVTWPGFSSWSFAGPVVTDGTSGQAFTADFDDFWVSQWNSRGDMTSPWRPAPGEIQSCQLSWDVDLPYYSNITVWAQASQYASFWDVLRNGQQLDFGVRGNMFRYYVNLSASFGNVGTPVLSEVRGNLTFKDQPKNASIDIGNHGAWDWLQPGTLGSSTINVNFAGALAREVQTATADGQGMVTIPLTAHSDGNGWLNVTGLVIRYVVNSAPFRPVLEGPANGTWLTTLNPSLTFAATDEDGGTLQYQIELFTHGTATPFLRIDQNASSTGWSAKYYEAGAGANYTFPFGRELGQGKSYDWRVRAFDGFAYGPWAEKSSFSIDTTPPDGYVIDDGSETSNGTSLHCMLTLADGESGVVEYEVWLGTTPGGSDVKPRFSVADPNVTVDGLTLIYGYRYFFTARALNGAGLWGNPVSSDGIGLKKGAVNREPVVNITSPSEGQSLTGVVKLAGKASDIDFLDTLTVFVRVDDGEWMEAEGNLSWTFSWDSNKVGNGAHTITARAEDGRASSAPYAVNVTVTNIHDIGIISSEPSAEPKMAENSAMTFSVEARDPLNRVLGYQWFFDGVPQQGETKRVFTYRSDYSSAGKHEITVSVFAAPDQTNFTWQLTVENVNRPPTANIAAPLPGAILDVGKAVMFDATGSSDPDAGDNLSYAWNFGDGTTGSGPTTEHTYRKAGRYSVTLTVKDPYTYTTVPVEVEVRATAAAETDFWAENGMTLVLLFAMILVVALVAMAVTASRRRRATYFEKERPAAGRVQAPPERVIESTISEQEEAAFRGGAPAAAPSGPAYEVAEQPVATGYEAARAEAYGAPAEPAYGQPAGYGSVSYGEPPDTGRPAWAAPVRRPPPDEAGYPPAAPAYQEPAPAYAAPAAEVTTLAPPPGAADEMARLLASLEGAPPAAPAPARPAPSRPAWAAPAPAAPALARREIYAPAQAEPSMEDIFAKLRSIGEEFETPAPAPAPQPRPPAAPHLAAPAAPRPAAPAPAPPAPAYAPTRLPVKPAVKKKLMRCPKCQVIFEVLDTGQRPLPIKCTACGATGAIKK